MHTQQPYKILTTTSDASDAQHATYFLLSFFLVSHFLVRFSRRLIGGFRNFYPKKNCFASSFIWKKGWVQYWAYQRTNHVQQFCHKVTEALNWIRKHERISVSIDKIIFLPDKDPQSLVFDFVANLELLAEKNAETVISRHLPNQQMRNWTFRFQESQRLSFVQIWRFSLLDILTFLG